jgi:putative membrane protein
MNKEFESKVAIEAFKNLNVARAVVYIMIASGLVLLFLFWLLYFREGAEVIPDWVYSLPTVNAIFNSIATVFLILGFVQIRKRKFDSHMKFNLAAFVASAFFLISYVLYHNFVGHTPFPGEGWIRPVYFFILISHIILSVVVVPLILSSFFFAFAGKFAIHRRVSKFTFPIWIYVSITGVVIYFILNAYI